MTERELLEALIGAFKMRRELRNQFGQEERAKGIEECIGHLEDYLGYINECNRT